MPAGARNREAASPRRDPVARRLYEKAKQLGTWDPAAIDLTRDAKQWPRLSEDERDFLLGVTSLFAAGEEAVTRDLLPVAFVAASERRLDDELFVTAWLWEEGKHADFFRRFLDEVVGGEPAAEPRRLEHRRILLEEELPRVMGRLLVDQSPIAQARALTTYCLVVEGVLADAGQFVFAEALETRDLLPGLRAGLLLVNRDESRHVAYGLHVIRRLTHVDPAVAHAVTSRVKELAPLTKALADSVVVDRTRSVGVTNALREPVERLLAQLTRLEPGAADALGLS